MIRRERDPYTRAISLVISRGFGLHVKLTLWWFSVSYHRRDLGLEASMARAARQIEEDAAARERLRELAERELRRRKP